MRCKIWLMKCARETVFPRQSIPTSRARMVIDYVPSWGYENRPPSSVMLLGGRETVKTLRLLYYTMLFSYLDEGFHAAIEVRALMARRHLHADARLALWHHGVVEPCDVDPLLQ